MTANGESKQGSAKVLTPDERGEVIAKLYGAVEAELRGVSGEDARVICDGLIEYLEDR